MKKKRGNVKCFLWGIASCYQQGELVWQDGTALLRKARTANCLPRQDAGVACRILAGVAVGLERVACDHIKNRAATSWYGREQNAGDHASTNDDACVRRCSFERQASGQAKDRSRFAQNSRQSSEIASSGYQGKVSVKGWQR